MSQIFDHNYSEWAKNKRMENGASTYSRDIIKYHKEALLSIGDMNIISTCPHFNLILRQHIEYNIRRNYDNAIQYLHEYPFINAVEWCCNFYNKVINKPQNKILLVTSYKSLQERLKVEFKKRQLDNVMDVAYVPMGIDTSILPKPSKEKHGENKVIWLGNIYKSREETFLEVKTAFKKAGWELDYISKSRLNDSNEVLTQSEIWNIVNQYSYGVGVGRSLLEMSQMGLKVLIAGNRLGGICMDEDDVKQHVKTNFGGRISTFDKNIHACVSMLPYSIDIPVDDIKNINHAEIISECL